MLIKLRQETGFTLIELLVVIAIISIISSTLIVAIDPKSQTDETKKVKYLSEAKSLIINQEYCDLYGRGNSSCASISSQTCGDLGWGTGSVLNTTLGAYADCGSSIGGDCTSAVTWEEANQKCSDVGGRLCTLAELTDGVSSGTGCGWNANLIWTSTPCDNGFYLRYGTTGSSPNYTYCQEDIFSGVVGGGNYGGSDIAVRCCADD